MARIGARTVETDDPRMFGTVSTVSGGARWLVKRRPPKDGPDKHDPVQIVCGGTSLSVNLAFTALYTALNGLGRTPR